MKLTAHGIHFSYRERQVLAGVDLSLVPGELVGLLGANGAGKSTLLKIMLGLQRPGQGAVALNGKPLHEFRRRNLAQSVAYVPQTHAAPFPYKVREVVLMGRLPAGGLFKSPCNADLDVVERILAHLGIAHLADRPYTEVSGGERQLALIARALAQNARLLVMDEPFSGLDYGHQIRLFDRLKMLTREGYGILMTTHDPDQTLAGCHRVALLLDGGIVADGTPDEALTPEAIHHLYGVRVELLRAADGRGIAFRPLERKTA